MAAAATALISISLSSGAAGQDGSEVATLRTPANAQRFLSVHPPIRLHVWPPSAPDLQLEVVSVSSSGPCKTVLKLAAAYLDAGDSWEIDWQKVRGVKIHNGQISLNYPPIYPRRSAVGTFSLGFGSEESVQRAMGAMQYLQSACDQAADTGF